MFVFFVTSVFGPCFVMQHFLFSLVLQSSPCQMKKELVANFICVGKCSVSLPQGAVDWSLVCDYQYGISWSFSLVFSWFESMVLPQTINENSQEY